MPRPKKPSVEIEIEVEEKDDYTGYTFDGLSPTEATDLYRERNSGRERDEKAYMPTELQPFVLDGDRFFSLFRQLALAERRRAGEIC